MMAIKLIHQGEDYVETFSRTVSGVVTPHADITEIEVVLFIDATEIEKFSKTDRTGDGYTRLTEESDEGKYTLKLPAADTAVLRADKIVVGEFTFILSTGDKRRFSRELGKVKKMNS